MTNLRPEHAVIGEGFGMLLETDVLDFGDEYGFISELLDPQGGTWHKVSIDDVYKDISAVIKPDQVFRRRKRESYDFP